MWSSYEIHNKFLCSSNKFHVKLCIYCFIWKSCEPPGPSYFYASVPTVRYIVFTREIDERTAIIHRALFPFIITNSHNLMCLRRAFIHWSLIVLCLSPHEIPWTQWDGIPMFKIRRSQDRLIFNTGIPVLVRRHLYIETAPRPPAQKLF